MALPAVLQNLALPVVASPMFIVSYPELVLAQCKAGIVGSFPALNARPAGVARRMAHADSARSSPTHQRCASGRGHRRRLPSTRSFINRIRGSSTTCAYASNTRCRSSSRACARRAEIIDAVHGYGGIVLHDVINPASRAEALEAGVDGLILVASGAGGTRSTTSPFALVRRSAAHLRRPDRAVGLDRERRARSSPRRRWARTSRTWARAFIADRKRRTRVESYKHAIVSTSASDIIYANLFTGVHGNYIRESIV